MPRTVAHAKLDNRTARARLKRGRQPHWQALLPNWHLGYQRSPEAPAGRWLARHALGGSNYRVIPIAPADDDAQADGESILDYHQARATAMRLAETPGGPVVRMTVRQAYERYVKAKENLGQVVPKSKATVHILPVLGDRVVSELTADDLRQWLADMASAPAQSRPNNGKPRYRPGPTDDEGVRKRRASANRVLGMLKSILNHAFDEGHVPHRDAWGRKLRPLKDASAARVRYLSIAECRRLINVCDDQFRPLVRGALETGCRYSELARMQVTDFNPDAGTLAVRKSKSGKPRHVILAQPAIEFFRSHTAGREGNEIMFLHGDREWRHVEQDRPMREANKRAKLVPKATFHALRHTWASHAVMNGMPLMVVARNLGHRDTRMVETHYGHLAPDFVRDAIRKSAPDYGLKVDKKITPLR